MPLAVRDCPAVGSGIGFAGGFVWLDLFGLVPVGWEGDRWCRGIGDPLGILLGDRTMGQRDRSQCSAVTAG